jgi:hypothetical protein
VLADVSGVVASVFAQAAQFDNLAFNPFGSDPKLGEDLLGDLQHNPMGLDNIVVHATKLIVDGSATYGVQHINGIFNKKPMDQFVALMARLLEDSGRLGINLYLGLQNVQHWPKALVREAIA